MTLVAEGGADATDVPYILRINRLTVDKLGVKLYDKVSAVVAELVANSYDADAGHVAVRLPMGTQLATKTTDGMVQDCGWVIEVEDDGHGMTPSEARRDYLEVGRDRRKHVGQGPASREMGRPVMGRKGIGKLAPFGICTIIDVRSAGGDPNVDGHYLTSHFVLDYEEVVSGTDDELLVLTKGPDDNTWSPRRGTRVRLTQFQNKRVPDAETFMRQLERRFAVARDDFAVEVIDQRVKDSAARPMTPFQVPTVASTQLDLTNRPVPFGEQELAVTGWLGMAQESYRNDEMAGVRIYARGKIVATTRDFEQPAGFTGEFTIRSYLVGEVHADWLDRDDGEDLIRTDRQEILWESDLGHALRNWGADLIREMGASMRAPRRERARRSFLRVARMRERAEAAYTDESVIDAAMQLAERIGSLSAEDELDDSVYVDDMAEIVLSVAPQQALMNAFRAFDQRTEGEDQLQGLLDLFGKTRIAEMASYAQIAAQRVRVLEQLEEIVFDEQKDESHLQRIITEAPWLIQPDWSVITANQALSTFKRHFEKYWETQTGQTVELAITFGLKRPDFVLVATSGRLHIVEIKASGHRFNDHDFDRMYNYVVAFSEFFANNEEMTNEYSQGWLIDLVADGTDLRDAKNKTIYQQLVDQRVVHRESWSSFQTRAIRANELFLQVRDQVAEQARAVEAGLRPADDKATE